MEAQFSRLSPMPPRIFFIMWTYSWAMFDEWFRKPHWTAYIILAMFVFFLEPCSSKSFYVHHLCLCPFCSFHSSHHHHHRLSSKFHVFGFLLINCWSRETATTSDVICMESLLKNNCLLVKKLQLWGLLATKMSKTCRSYCKTCFLLSPQKELGKKLEIKSHDLPKIAGTAPFLLCTQNWTLFVDTSETELSNCTTQRRVKY